MDAFKEKKKINKKELFDLILLTICIPILAIGIVVSFSMLQSKRVGNVPTLFGYSFLTIVSESMEPEFLVGDSIVVKHVSPSEIKVGDVISFHRGNKVVTHKVNLVTTAKLDGKDVIAWQTYGINNQDVDGNFVMDSQLVPETALVGRFHRKGGASNFVEFMSSPWGLVLLVILPLGFIIISDIFTLMNIVFDIKNEKFDNAYRYRRQLNLLGKSIDDYVIVRIASRDDGKTQYMLAPSPPDKDPNAPKLEDRK